MGTFGANSSKRRGRGARWKSVSDRLDSKAILHVARCVWYNATSSGSALDMTHPELRCTTPQLAAWPTPQLAAPTTPQLVATPQLAAPPTPQLAAPPTPQLAAPPPSTLFEVVLGANTPDAMSGSALRGILGLNASPGDNVGTVALGATISSLACRASRVRRGIARRAGYWLETEWLRMLAYHIMSYTQSRVRFLFTQSLL